ncbi:MAG TPA: VWA domain-containing protein [Candidatus Angelobacter sp.]|nr:VWA domain-containing protein [Candidatus Angelobacter sp.]
MRPALLLLLLSPCLALAQDCAQIVPAIMVDETTRTFLPGITADRLHAKLGSAVVPVTSVERIPGFRVLILFDTSGSMEQKDSAFIHQHKALALVNRTLDELLGELPQRTKIEYGLFNNDAAFGPAFTANPEELRRSFSDLTERMKGRKRKATALYDALRESLARFDPPQPGDSVLLVTDGMDNESRLRAGKVQEEAARKGVRVFTILITDDKPDIDGSRLVILDFAERTGGSVHVISVDKSAWSGDKEPEAERLELRRFWNNEVLSGYLLRFNVPAGARNQRKWLLKVDRLPGQQSKTLAAYPSRLNACPVATAAAH